MAAASITTTCVATRQAQVAESLEIPAPAEPPAIAKVLAASACLFALLAATLVLVVLADVLAAFAGHLALLAAALVIFVDADSTPLAVFTMILLPVVNTRLALISALLAAILVIVVLALLVHFFLVHFFLVHFFLPRISTLAVQAATGTVLVLLKLKTDIALFGFAVAWSCR